MMMRVGARAVTPVLTPVQWLHVVGALSRALFSETPSVSQSLYYYARVVDVIIGLAIVMAVAMVFPWCDNSPADSSTYPCRSPC